MWRLATLCMYGCDSCLLVSIRPIIFDYISSLLTSAQSYSILLIERAVVGLLRLCLLICDQVRQRAAERSRIDVEFSAVFSYPA